MHNIYWICKQVTGSWKNPDKLCYFRLLLHWLTLQKEAIWVVVAIVPICATNLWQRQVVSTGHLLSSFVSIFLLKVSLWNIKDKTMFMISANEAFFTIPMYSVRILKSYTYDRGHRGDTGNKQLDRDGSLVWDEMGDIGDRGRGGVISSSSPLSLSPPLLRMSHLWTHGRRCEDRARILKEFAIFLLALIEVSAALHWRDICPIREI